MSEEQEKLEELRKKVQEEARKQIEEFNKEIEKALDLLKEDRCKAYLFIKHFTRVGTNSKEEIQEKAEMLMTVWYLRENWRDELKQIEKGQKDFEIEIKSKLVDFRNELEESTYKEKFGEK